VDSKFVEKMTYAEIAAELGISRQRVRQIEEAALNKLRNNSKVRDIYEGLINGRVRGSDNRDSASPVCIRDSRAG
jgi:predicted transcriptional regulator